MPPASKKFLAKFARAVNSAAVPSVARKIFGRAPVLARIWSDASRSRSNGSASSDPRQCLAGRARRLALRHRPRRRVENRRRDFMQVGKRIGAGQDVLAARHGVLPFGAHRGDVALDQTLFQRRPGAAGFFDVLEQRPRRGAKLLPSAPRSRRSRRPDRRPGQGSILPTARAGCCARCAAQMRRAGRAAPYAAATAIASAPPRPAAATAMVVRSMFT